MSAPVRSCLACNVEWHRQMSCYLVPDSAILEQPVHSVPSSMMFLGRAHRGSVDKTSMLMCRYEVDDLRVTDILSQMVVLSETYMQIYELKKPV